MSRAIGWRHVLPWSFGIIGLFVLVHVALAWIVEAKLSRAGERSVAARVEVGETRVTLLGSRLSLRNITVANPHAPLRNLVEADRCDIQFEPDALLHKRAVVRHGAVTGLRFGTPRDTNGALPGAQSASDSPLDGWLDLAAAQAAQDWLDRLNKRFDRDLVGQLVSMQLTDELIRRWPQHSAELEKRATALRQRTVDFQADVQQAQLNPLRHVEFLERVPDELTKIRADVMALSRDVENLPNVADEDRRAIVAAREHDERLLREKLQFDRIDTNVLSAYLLQQQLSGPLGELISYLRWIRQIVPVSSTLAQSESATDAGNRQRGRNIHFAGCQLTPDLLVRTLQLQGTARIAGQPLEFFGTLSDVSDRPACHDQPMRLRLSSRGALPLELHATIDRTGPVARDQLLVDCGGLVLPKFCLGGSDKLRLSLAPTTASLNISIVLEGEKLSGDIQLVQKQVEITPTVGDSLAQHGVDEELEKTLGDVRSLATRISLAGTLDVPQCRVWSNLGPAVAEAMDQALARTADGYARQLLSESRERVNQRLAEFDRQLADQQVALQPQLAESTTALRQLTQDDGPTHRLSLEHLGRRLPADSLFR